jgi:predicted dehydrogenase/threonine dehydrogenase-like Zn-dependent dehydrogenase
MEQLTQQLKSGQMDVLEVPIPTMSSTQILVRNHYSVISAGTEGKTVSDARKGYIAKAKSRQKEVKMVVDMIKRQGVLETYKFVMNKLEAASPLGYSCSGEVIAVGDDIHDIKVGDYVACGGQGAYHADIVSVERNLSVKVPENVSLQEAAFATVASIAMQGVRQTDLKIGETVAIIGMGLIGELSMQFFNVSGVKTIAIDVNSAQVSSAQLHGASLALNRNQEGIEQIIGQYTNGNGVDAVLITAGTTSLDPIEFSGRITRKKGRVVVLGAVPTGFSRPEYYKKELELRMSCSYGPGRYDNNYEEKGIDYPLAYVRWTENRNMQAFIDLLSEGKIDIKSLITHNFEIENAADAYKMILDKSEPYIGITIEYDKDKIIEDEPIIINDRIFNSEDVNVAFIGAGHFAQGTLLPALSKINYVNYVGVITGHGNTSKYVADKYGFHYCTDNARDIVSDKDANTVFVCTRHNLHAKYVIDAINAGKNVFVEKPLAMNMDELQAVKDAYVKSNVRVMVGFNRRFSPAVKKIKKMFLPIQVKAINIMVNAGAVPKDHWVHDPKVGGGRIVGEACHFIDLAMFLADSQIKSVYAKSLQDTSNLNDTVIISISFANGSIANISYYSNGNKNLPKEYIEVFCDGTVAQIDDFTKLVITGKTKKTYKFKQDKGHINEISAFCDSIKNGKEAPISFEECFEVMKATFDVINQL